MQLYTQPIIESYPDEDVGRALKLVMRYFKDKTMPTADESLMAIALFSLLKPEADNSFNEYEKAVIDGMKAKLSTKGKGG